LTSAGKYSPLALGRVIQARTTSPDDDENKLSIAAATNVASKNKNSTTAATTPRVASANLSNSAKVEAKTVIRIMPISELLKKLPWKFS